MSEKRSSFFLFINTTPSSTGAGSYALVGDGVTELTISYNPQTNTEQFIHQDTANTNLTGYQPNAPVTAQVIKGDLAFEYINSIRKKLPIGSDAHTDIVMLDKYDVLSGSSTGSYPAIKQKVAVQIDSYGGAASDPLSIGYTLNWLGPSDEGTFNIETKAWSGESSGASTYGSGLEV